MKPFICRWCICFCQMQLIVCAAAAPLLAEPDPIVWEISGEVRSRYETLDGQFRSSSSGGDQGLFFRTLLHVKAESKAWTAGVELQDSRSYLTDSGSPISSSYVNPVDILQAYLELPVKDLFGSDFGGSLKLGRQTISIGSKRQIERVSYANVIKNYTGAYLKLDNAQSDEWHFFAASPLERRPQDRGELLDNNTEFDREQFNRVIWGAHFRKADPFSTLLPGAWAEAFVYGLHEWDAFGNESPNRQYFTPGGRLYRPAEPGRWNIDLEGALRVGQRRATSNPSDTRDLDVFATMLLFRVGYTFDHPWKPNLAAQYYWASGDDEPNNDRFDQYERLFGGRRTDLNNTSLHGPLTPANLSAPGLRFEMQPTENATFRLTYSAAFLASRTDAFIIGRQRDPRGESGSFIGHVIDSRVTWEIPKTAWDLEAGFSFFSHGDFTRTNPQAPEADSTSFAYTQLRFRF